MLPPVTRVCVEVTPKSWLLENGVLLRRVRVAVDSGGHTYVRDISLQNDDFVTRFDQLFEMAKCNLQTAIEREAKTQQTESIHDEAQEGDPAPLHEKGRQVGAG
jgi:hypothetical protein